MADTEEQRKARLQSVSGQRTGEVGALLRGARLSAGKDLRDVADALRIRHPYLVAIEEGKYSELPGATYAVGFVRSYAEYVHLDGKEIVRRFKEESAMVPKSADLDFPAPASEASGPSGSLIVIALVLGGLAYGAWYWSTTSDRPFAQMIQDVPDRLASLVDADSTAPSSTVDMDKEEPPVAPAPDAPATAVAPVVETPAAAVSPALVAESDPVRPAPAPAEVVIATRPAPEPVIIPATPEAEAATAPDGEGTSAETVVMQPPPEGDVQPEAAPAAPVIDAGTPAPAPEAELPAVTPVDAPVTPAVAAQPAASGPGQVVLIAREDSWVQVRDTQGLLLSRLLKAGERYTVPDGNGLTLMVGNAGGLRIAIDGTELPSLGRTGEVRRGVSLNPASLRRTFGGTN